MILVTNIYCAFTLCQAFCIYLPKQSSQQPHLVGTAMILPCRRGNRGTERLNNLAWSVYKKQLESEFHPKLSGCQNPYSSPWHHTLRIQADGGQHLNQGSTWRQKGSLKSHTSEIAQNVGMSWSFGVEEMERSEITSHFLLRRLNR